MGGEATNLEERLDKREDDCLAELARDPTNGFRDLLTMYRGWGSGAADYFLETLDPATLSPELRAAKKKTILGRVRHSITKPPGLPDAQRRELEELAATVAGTAFEARLAERRGVARNVEEEIQLAQQRLSGHVAAGVSPAVALRESPNALGQRAAEKFHATVRKMKGRGNSARLCRLGTCAMRSRR
jgi:hypothetical protein